ncbi:MAG: filamentous hemagglutinin N-terminal domain-containing protein, partial [Xenococcaceae cyanobacterium MO_167.B27]|nr:filamentous hemagglutinin N-terminal domain-containing protein [Xenococcaceae cyanobacterium MO_167.B27]
MKPWCELLVGLFLGTVIAVPVKAQITPDGTTNTSLTPTDNGIRIDGGDQRSCCLGHRVGYNLFHSFREFSVINGTEAFFNNGSDIVNIFSRVTGGDVSRIDGLIRANGKANLYLINPAGIIFGENASLNIGGSFLGSTANSIVFPEGEFLATDGDHPPILTINMPIGLTFGNNPGEIAVNASNLQVNNGEAFVLLGGNVSIAGAEITAPGARIELGGVAEFGQVSFNLQQSGEDFGIDSISFPEGVARADVTLTNGVEVNVRAAGGGSISVNGRNIKISGGELGGSSLIAGIASESRSTEAVAGDITLNATNDITVSQGSRIFNRVEESGVGNSGGINITTTNLFLTEGSVVNASIFGEGNGGTININASGTISADKVDQDGLGSGIFSQVGERGVGNSGGINITTTKLFLRQGGQVTASTFGDGNAGAITIKASDTISADGADQHGSNSGIFSQVGERGMGNSGGINITTTKLSLTQGGRVSASTFGDENAGAITIKAFDTISADGEDQDGGANSGIFSQVGERGMGNSGGINITTTKLFLRQGGRVSASTFGDGNSGAITIKAFDTISADGEDQDGGANSGIFSQVRNTGMGNSGGINITTTKLFLRQGGQVTASTFGDGNAGTISIQAFDTISADGEDQDGFNSGIFSTVEKKAIGTGGGIDITTAKLLLRQGGQVTASTFGDGNAGTITIKASDTISADGADQDGFNSGIFSTVEEFGKGNANDIKIYTNNLYLTNDAEISVESLGQGNADNLYIQANSLALSTGAALSASTPVGIGGNITLQIADNLTIRDNSTISAEALEDADGGNITIDADFVIAFPNQNNDIIARAAEGIGGEINITTNGIFGIEERNSQPPNNTNDLDASSDIGLDGEVLINQPDVNPTEALEELPSDVVDVTRLVAQNLCQQGKGSEFIVTGKGGKAPSPSQVRNGEISEIDLVEPAPTSPPTPLLPERGALDHDSQQII